SPELPEMAIYRRARALIERIQADVANLEELGVGAYTGLTFADGMTEIVMTEQGIREHFMSFFRNDIKNILSNLEAASQEAKADKITRQQFAYATYAAVRGAC